RSFSDVVRDGAGRLTDRTRERAEAAIGIDDSNRLRGLLARPGHHLGPHVERLYRGAGLGARGSMAGGCLLALERMACRRVAVLGHTGPERRLVFPDGAAGVAAEEARVVGDVER